MAAPKGNQFYKFVTKWKEKKYTPAKLWDKAVQYLEWCDKNPLKEAVVFGSGFTTTVNKMRAPTLEGFYLYANISHPTFQNYETHKDYLTIVTRIRHLLRVCKIEGAAAGMLNASIISRELGLADKTELSGQLDITQITGMKVD